jgi:ammonium transporter, Amt family
MLWIMKRSGKPDPGMMANGMLAGLVAITAPCYFVQPWHAAIIGAIAGVLVIESIAFIERRGVDDVVGAISVHGVCGSFGVLAVGIFSDGSRGQGWNLTTTNGDGGVQGILYGFGNIDQLAAQAIGVVMIWTVIFGFAFGFFTLQNKLMKGGIRSKEEDEIEGLDLPEMGVLAYPEFMGSHLPGLEDQQVADPGGTELNV